MSLLGELSRRNVNRVAIAYVIAAWVIIQVADLVLENIGAPDWVIQAIMLVVALGFPVVLIFSWAYEVTPEGIKRESEIDRTQSITGVTGRKLDRAIITLLVVALAYFVWGSREAAPPTTEPTQVARDASPAVAINSADSLSIAGDTDKALASIERQFEHGHIAQWNINHRLPIYDPIRQEPRFVAIHERYDRRLAELREAAGL